MIPVGGLRARLVHDSFQRAVHDGLSQLGWFDPGRAHRPLTLVAGPAEWDVPIDPNRIVIDSGAWRVEAAELGSNLTQDTIRMNIDIYGESESFSTHVANDLRDILRGRQSVNAFQYSMPILDYRQATPVPIGHASVLDVRITRLPPRPNRPYTEHWLGLDVNLSDAYYDSTGA